MISQVKIRVLLLFSVCFVCGCSVTSVTISGGVSDTQNNVAYNTSAKVELEHP